MVDPALVKAIAEVVKELGQPAPVALRLTAWLNEMSLADPTREEQQVFLDSLREAIVTKDIDNED